MLFSFYIIKKYNSSNNDDDYQDWNNPNEIFFHELSFPFIIFNISFLNEINIFFIYILFELSINKFVWLYFFNAFKTSFFELISINIAKWAKFLGKMLIEFLFTIIYSIGVPV